MRSVSIASVALFCCFSCLAGTARAEKAAPDYARTGIYISGSAVFATDLYEDEIEDAFDGVSVDIDSTFGAGARIGVRFLRILALELDYEWLDEYDIDLGFTNVGSFAQVSLEQHTLTANLRLFAPLGRFQPYVLAGIGFQYLDARVRATNPLFNVDSTIDDTALAGRVGLGFDLYVTEHIALFAEGLVVLTNEEVRVTVLGVGSQEIDNIFYAGARWGATFRF